MCVQNKKITRSCSCRVGITLSICTSIQPGRLHGDAIVLIRLYRANDITAHKKVLHTVALKKNIYWISHLKYDISVIPMIWYSSINLFIYLLTCLLFSYRYIASRTFARWLLYPGSTSLLNSMIGKCEIYTIMILFFPCKWSKVFHQCTRRRITGIYHQLYQGGVISTIV